MFELPFAFYTHEDTIEGTDQPRQVSHSTGGAAASWVLSKLAYGQDIFFNAGLLTVELTVTFLLFISTIKRSILMYHKRIRISGHVLYTYMYRHIYVAFSTVYIHCTGMHVLCVDNRLKLSVLLMLYQ